MSLGFGKVAPGEWEKRASGGRADKVPVGDYFAKASEVVIFPPEKNDKNLGTIVVRFLTTEQNAAEFEGKTLEFRGMFDPAPKTDGRGKMNEITENNLIQMCAAAGVDPQADPSGAYDIVETVKLLPQVEAVLIGSVSHRTHDGKEYQDFESFRPVS